MIWTGISGRLEVKPFNSKRSGDRCDNLWLECFERIGFDGQPLDIIAAGNPNACLFIPIRAHYDRGVLRTISLHSGHDYPTRFAHHR